MGCFGSKSSGGGGDHATENGGEPKVKRQRSKTSNNAVSAVLLGLQGCGKSTIRKQLQLIYGGTFTVNELETYKNIVIMNLIQVTQQILQYAKKQQETEIDAETDSCKMLLGISNVYDFTITPEVVTALQQVWKYKRAHELIDVAVKEDMKPAANYFKEHLNRVFAPDYMPTEMDVLLVRQRTAGINAIDFEMEGKDKKSDSKKKIHLVDGGGQLAERRKWNTYINENNTVIYVIGIDEYDVPAADKENKVTTLEHSLEILETTLTYCKENNKPVIVFLNKTDLFAAKLKKVQFSTFYPDCKAGDTDPEVSKKFLEEKVTAIGKKHNCDNLYTYLTCALDRDLVKRVFESVRDHLVNRLIDTNFGFD